MEEKTYEEMEDNPGISQGNLEQQIWLLEKRISQNLTRIRIALLLFILLTEILPYFQQFRMLNKWHALSPIIRFSSYAAYLVIQYFVSRAVTQKKFGKHLDRLKGLLKEIN